MEVEEVVVAVVVAAAEKAVSQVVVVARATTAIRLRPDLGVLRMPSGVRAKRAPGQMVSFCVC